MTNTCSSCQAEQKVAKEAVVYCIECDEYFCIACSQVHNKQPPLKTHSTIPCPCVSTFPLDVLKKSVKCGCSSMETVEYYCSNHCLSFCFDCLIKKHRLCDYNNVDSISKGVKSSFLFGDLSDRIERTYELTKTLKICNTENLKDLLRQTTEIEVELHSILNRINCAFLKIINASKSIFSEEYRKLQIETEELKTQEQEIEQIKNEFNQISEFCSETKIFLSIIEIEEKFQNLTRDHFSSKTEGNIIELKISRKEALASVLEEIDEMNIYIDRKTFDNVGKLMSPAQLTIGPSVSKEKYEVPSVILLREIDISRKGVKDPTANDCTVYQDGITFAVEQKHVCLLEFKSNGELRRNVAIPSTSVSCIAGIDQNNFAITVNENVIIYNKKSMNILNQVQIRDECSGISKFSNKNFLVGCKNAGMVLIGNDGKREKVFHMKEIIHSHQDLFIGTHNTEIFCSVQKKDMVLSYDRSGKKKSEYQDKKLKGPRGIAVDGNNIFIAGFYSNNILWATVDGEQFKEILTDKEGIRNPRGICYNKDLNILVICNHNGSKISTFQLTTGETNK